MIGSKIVNLFVPARSPNFFADEFDTIKCVSKQRPIASQAI
jgi:hypothetical protein